MQRQLQEPLSKKNNNSAFLILVDFGENNTEFIVFSGGVVRFTSSIPIGSRTLTETVSKTIKVAFHEAEKLKIEYGLYGRKAGKSKNAEKILTALTPVLNNLATQIKKYSDFYQEHSAYENSNSSPKKVESGKVLFCGGGSKLRGLADFMSEKLDFPVEIGNPLINLLPQKSKDRAVKGNLASFVTAIGLALRNYD